MAEAVELCGYVFDKYKQKENDDEGFSPREVFVTELSEEDAAEGRKLAAAQIMTRELANEPGNLITPPVLAGRAEALDEASAWTARSGTRSVWRRSAWALFWPWDADRQPLRT